MFCLQDLDAEDQDHFLELEDRVVQYATRVHELEVHGSIHTQEYRDLKRQIGSDQAKLERMSEPGYQSPKRPSDVRAEASSETAPGWAGADEQSDEESQPRRQTAIGMLAPGGVPPGTTTSDQHKSRPVGWGFIE